MKEHFYIESDDHTYKSNDGNSYCGKTPAVVFDPFKIADDDWCPECYEIFEKGALGSLTGVITEMAKRDI